jgi:hypothetical protein
MKGVGEAWFMLQRDKSVQARTVFSRIPKANLSVESLKDPKVLEEVNRLGYYDVAHNRPEELVGGLEALVELGYVSKTKDRIVNTRLFYVAHPYLPYIAPSGALTITSKSSSPFESFDLRSEQFKRFRDTARDFKSQVDAGRHAHITRFEFGVNFDYETDIYELKNKYYDALHVAYSPAKEKLFVWLTTPFVESHDGKDSKNWEKLGEVGETIFLKNIDKMNALVDGLEWKKKAIGIVIHRDRAFTMVPPEVAKEAAQERQPSFWQMPDFLDNGMLSHGNFISRTFEDSTAEYLAKKFDYRTKPRVKPAYLEGREIDVFADKGATSREVTVCECKFRFSDSPLTMSEIEAFEKKIQIVEDNERKAGGTKFHFWMVTNAKTLEEGVEEYATKTGIEIMRATLSSNWARRSDWTVVNLSKFQIQ